MITYMRKTVTPLLWFLCLCSFTHAHEIDLPSGIAAPGETITIIKNELGFTEGPAQDSEYNLYFTDLITGTIWKITDKGNAGVFRKNSNKANGLAFDSGGNLIACEINRVTSTEISTGTITTLTEVKGPGEPNDLCITPWGGIFFTSPLWNKYGTIYYLSPDLELKALLSPVRGFPNGIEFDAKDKYLYVAMTQLNQIWKYSVDYKMDLQYMGIFARITTPDGCTFDERGNLWVASCEDSKIIVLDSTGTIIGSIRLDNESVQNCYFGGPDKNILYMTARTAV